MCILNVVAVPRRLQRRLQPLLLAATAAWRTPARLVVHRTATAAQGRRAAFRAAVSGASRVLAAGGDGTVRSAAQGLLDARRGTPLGIVPLGRGNDLARSLGIAPGIDGLARRPRGTRRVQMDVGTIDTGRGPQVFLGAVGVGFEGAVARYARHLRGLRAGAYRVAAAGALVTGVRARCFEGQLDGRAWRGVGASLHVANAPCTGGGLCLAPAARLDDGALDLALCTAGTVCAVMATLTRVLGRRGSAATFEHRRVRRLELRIRPSAPVHADGELLGMAVSEMRIALRPAALTVEVPR